MSQTIPTILYEDENLFVINKPAGLVVHSDGRTTESNLSDWVKEKYPSIKDVGGLHTLDSGRYVERWGIVHRLDRETSGVIIIAKNDDTFYALQRQFLDRTIEKTYVAFVHGIPMPKEGMIDDDIGRSRSDFRRWTTGEDARGTLRSAITKYRTIDSSMNGEYSMVELSPETGRTHQLRVHMRTIGNAILCDSRYDSASGLGFTRLALHALSLSVKLPNGKQEIFVAELPEDFIAAKTALR